METDTCPFDQEFVYLCTKKVCQGSLSRNSSILLFQNYYKKAPQNGENAYLVMKYPRASGALRWAPDPTLKRAHFARTMLLRTVGNLGLSRSGPPRSNPGSAPDYISTETDAYVKQSNVTCDFSVTS